jgi:hypothetical protein
MKRLLLSLLFLAAGSFGVSRAMDVADEGATDTENFVFDAEKKSVPTMCDTVVKGHREALGNSEEVRGRWQVVTAAAVAAGTSYLVYRWWNKASEKSALGERVLERAQRDLAVEDALSKLNAEELRKLQEEVKKKEKEEEEKAKAAGTSGTTATTPDAGTNGSSTTPASVPAVEPKKASEIKVEVSGTEVNKQQLEDFIYALVDKKTKLVDRRAWYTKAWDWTKDTATSAGGWLVFIPLILFKQRIAHEMSKYIFGYFPYPGQFASYLFTPRSVLWAMHEHTKFETVAKGLHMCAFTFKQVAQHGNAMASPDLLKLKAWYQSTLFVKEMEKIVGYMQYVIMQLPKEDQESRETGKASVKLITYTVNECAKIVNLFLKTDPIAPKHVAAIAGVMEDTLFAVVSELETFDTVARTAGFEDMDEGRRFDYWKSYLKPELPKTPMQQEAEAHAAEFADYKQVFEQIVDLKGILDAGF